MASDKRKLVVSAEKKLKEFLNLKYPIGMLWKACSRIAREECEGTWITIRRNIPSLIAKFKNTHIRKEKKKKPRGGSKSLVTPRSKGR